MVGIAGGFRIADDVDLAAQGLCDLFERIVGLHAEGEDDAVKAVQLLDLAAHFVGDAVFVELLYLCAGVDAQSGAVEVERMAPLVETLHEEAARSRLGVGGDDGSHLHDGDDTVMLAEEVCGLAAGQAAARDKNVSAGEDLAVENISDGEELLVVDAGDGGLCDERTGGEDDGVGCQVADELLVNFAVETHMYDLVIIDFDAGLEHFSRGTGSNSDTLIIVCDQSKLSFETAERITDMVDELNLPYSNKCMIGCRYDEKNKPIMEELAGRLGVDVLGFVGYDQEIASLNLAGKGLDAISDDNAALDAVKEMVKKILSEPA